MSTYILKTQQYIPIPVSKTWSFFSTPKNLNKITPKKVGFNILSIQKNTEAYAGQIILYSIRIMGVPVKWMTEITQVKEKGFFIDEQRFGPYKLWHHQHHFSQYKQGTMMEDIVHYKLPWGFIGSWAHSIFIKKMLQNIFNHRRLIIEEKWGKDKRYRKR